MSSRILMCSRMYTLSSTTFCMNRFGQSSLYWVLNNLHINWNQNIPSRALLGCQISERNSVYVSNKRLDFFLTVVYMYTTLLFYKKFFKNFLYCKKSAVTWLKCCRYPINQSKINHVHLYFKNHTINLYEEMILSKNKRRYTFIKTWILIFFFKCILDTFLFKVSRQWRNWRHKNMFTLHVHRNM